MGGSFSTVDYREQIIKYQTTFLSQEDNDSIGAFLLNSEDFYNVFTTCTLDDFRKIKEEKSDNIIYLISYVCFLAMTCQCIRVIHEAAIQYKVLSDDIKKKTVKGAIHLLTRMFPLLFEDKELLMRAMWREQALFGNQINALNMMEAISLLLFKPGYTVIEVADGIELQYYGILYPYSFILIRLCRN
jgi:High-temperature-induced dauer-formation protein